MTSSWSRPTTSSRWFLGLTSRKACGPNRANYSSQCTAISRKEFIMSKMSQLHASRFENNDANNEREFCPEGIEWLKTKEKEDLLAQIEEDWKDAQITIPFETFRNFCRNMKYDRNTLVEIKYILDELEVPKEAHIIITPVRQKGISTVYQFCWEANVIWEIDALDEKAVNWIEQLYKKF